MLSTFKKFLSLSLLVSTGAALAENCNSCTSDCDAPEKPITCFVPRSQSFNNMIKNAGMDPENQFLYDIDGFNASFKINFEYDQTFSSDKLGKCLFGPAAICVSGTGCDNDDAIALRVVGSNAASFAGASNPNGTTDLVADNFFLPKDFISTITVKPSIQNFNIHLQAYFGFDEWCTGLYARIYAPITVSRWKLETNEKFTNEGTDANGSYVAGEIAPAAVDTTGLYSSFLSYTQGNTLPNDGQLPGSTNPVVEGPTVQALKYTRFGSCDTDKTTQLADLRAELGWSFLLDEDYHLGLYIAAAAPTANDCEDDCNTLLWGAKAGNGAHWELGGGLTGHYTMWRSEECNQQFDFFVDATINHMFKHTEKRTFDLKDANGNNKPLSRYIMAQQLTTATTGLTVGGVQATYQFAGAYAPVANFSTQDVSVSFPVQADVMAKFVYTCKGFSWALGYDFWAQACPNVELDNCNDDCDATPFPANTWALRGDAHVYGFGVISDAAIGIPASYNATTAFNIGKAFEGTALNTDVNAGVDNATTPVQLSGQFVVTEPSPAAGVNIYASNQPIFITADNLDIQNVTRGMSNSIFTELNYTWTDRECWMPYLGIGARVEFGNNSEGGTLVNTTPPAADSDCGSCGTCSVSKWGVWIQGGVSFN